MHLHRKVKLVLTYSRQTYIIRQKVRPGEGIRLRQEWHLDGHFQFQAKPLI
jgi:hypothetical protein